MPLTIGKALDAVKNGMLTMSECSDLLTASEGKSSNFNTVHGHALQHSAMTAPDSVGFRPLHDKFHDRGLLSSTGQRNFNAKAPAIDGVNQWGKTVKVPGPGYITEVLTGANHTQFTDDQQAAMLLLLCLKSKAGVRALTALVDDPTDSVTVTISAPKGMEYNERATSLTAVKTTWSPNKDKASFDLKSGKPTVAELNSTSNFVLINRKDIGSVAAILRADGLGAGSRLHIQTFYPQSDPMSDGASSLESTKYPALDLTYL
ncbi:MAG: hypothetical protein ACK54K_12955 [Gemmatimonadaceae bacterium]